MGDLILAWLQRRPSVRSIHRQDFRYVELADETIAKYGWDEKRYFDALASISVNDYNNAKRNSLAQTRNWFINYEQASRRGTETNASIGGKLAD